MIERAIAAEDFAQMCAELSEKITQTMFVYPKAVAVCVIPGVMASVSKVLDIPRDTLIKMFDSALEDME